MPTVIKGVKLRLYPTQVQKQQLAQMFGNQRFVWNQLLAMAQKRYANNPRSQFISEYGMNYLLKPLKQEYSFLKASDATAFLTVTHNLNQAYQMLFKHRGGQPHFKGRKSWYQSYTGRSTMKVIAKRRIKLPKLGKVRASKTGRIPDGKIKQYTVSLAPAGKYYLSLQVETKIQPLPNTNRQVGIDVGLDSLAITSDGDKYATFQSKHLERRAKTWQHKYNRRHHLAKVAAECFNARMKGMAHQDTTDYQNWQRARILKVRAQAKITNQRKDYLHKLTTALVKRYDVIVIEDLKAKNLQKNHRLAKAVVNASWRQFRTMLEYKCQWYGKQLITVSPQNTSRICSNCGKHNHQFDNLATNQWLSIRQWDCPHCGTHHDRDINAAKNILNAGLTSQG